MIDVNHVLLQPSPVGPPIKWYEFANRARELMIQFPEFTFSHLEWESYAWPGGYEIYYIVADSGVLCHNCANENLMRTIDPDDDQFYIVDSDINYESTDVHCEHCYRQIQPAYGDY